MSSLGLNPKIFLSSLNIKILNQALAALSSVLSSALLIFLGLYRLVGTLFLGGACRFEPSCSEYAVEAVKIHKPFYAIKLIFIRLSKCRPGGPCGCDPVPRGEHAAK
jgi:putative membrane protein insertion efficiency factor